MSGVFRARGEALRASLEAGGLDGYLVADELSILYFTGFLGGARLLVPGAGKGESRLYVYGVNYESAARTAKDCRVERVERGDGADRAVATQLKLGFKRVGFDSMPASAYLGLRGALRGVRLEAQGGLVWGLRRVKDEVELGAVRRAAELTSVGMKTGLEALKPGLREYELAAEVEYAMRRRGSEGAAFDTIVASGAGSAFPHGGCTERRIQRGDLVMIDVGARSQHYRADMTRTAVAGRPTARQEEIHGIVREAHQRALQALRAGVEAREADAAARNLIEERGYGRHFVHGLGHGVGLEVHEPPTLSRWSRETLEAGNVVTAEPGIYVVDFGGVRIEDTVLVLEDGRERLTEAPYALEV